MRKVAKNVLNHMRSLSFDVPVVEFPVTPCTQSQDSILLHEIYSPSEDGVLSTDLSMLLSKKVRPEVAQFVQNNLMLKQRALDVMPHGMEFGELESSLAVSPYDSVESYSQRVVDVLNQLNKNEDGSSN